MARKGVWKKMRKKERATSEVGFEKCRTHSQDYNTLSFGMFVVIRLGRINLISTFDCSIIELYISSTLGRLEKP